MIRKVVIPAQCETNVNLNLPESYIGEEVEIIAFAKDEAIVYSQNKPALSPSLAGDMLTNLEFKSWVAQSESLPAITLTEAKVLWAKRKEELQNLTK